MSKDTIAVAHPIDPIKRAELAEIVGAPVPEYDDIVAMPCSRCEEPLAVPPKTRQAVASGSPLMCSVCVSRLAAEGQFHLAGFRQLGGGEATNHKAVISALKQRKP